MPSRWKTGVLSVQRVVGDDCAVFGSNRFQRGVNWNTDLQSKSAVKHMLVDAVSQHFCVSDCESSRQKKK